MIRVLSRRFGNVIPESYNRAFVRNLGSFCSVLERKDERLLQRIPPEVQLWRRYKTTSGASNAADRSSFTVLYKGPLMVPFYVLVRLKVIQLVGFGAMAIPINAWFSHVLFHLGFCEITTGVD